jgi:hypothetical protein
MSARATDGLETDGMEGVALGVRDLERQMDFVVFVRPLW